MISVGAGTPTCETVAPRPLRERADVNGGANAFGPPRADLVGGLLRPDDDRFVDVLDELLRAVVADGLLDPEIAPLQVREHREDRLAGLDDRQHRHHQIRYRGLELERHRARVGHVDDDELGHAGDEADGVAHFAILRRWKIEDHRDLAAAAKCLRQGIEHALAGGAKAAQDQHDPLGGGREQPADRTPLVDDVVKLGQLNVVDLDELDGIQARSAPPASRRRSIPFPDDVDVEEQAVLTRRLVNREAAHERAVDVRATDVGADERRAVENRIVEVRALQIGAIESRCVDRRRTGAPPASRRR